MSTSPWTLLSSWRRLFGLVLAFVVFPIANISAFSQTNFAIGSTVLHSPVKHLGVNLAGQTYYDSGQMLRPRFGSR